MEGPYDWSQSYLKLGADGTYTYYTKTGSDYVVDGCCEEPGYHYCPDGCRPVGDTGDNIHCCETNTYFCWKSGECISDEDPHDCCNEVVCPAKYGGGNPFCREDVEGWEEGYDCCETINVEWEECPTAHPNVSKDNIYSPESF